MIRNTYLAALIAFATALAAWGADSPAWTPVSSIDFSSKHEVLILNADGSTSPMDEPHFESTLIAPGTWQIAADGDYIYLIAGDREAIVVDTGYGAGNLRAYCQTLTSVPIRNVINTHSHFDHTANDAYFDRVLMSAKAIPLATIPYASFSGIQFPRNYPVTVVGDGSTYDLGNRVLEFFEIGNHTLDGIAVLDRKQRILFSGDEVMGARMNVNVTVEQFAANMGKLAAHRSEFDRLAGGPGIYDAVWVDKYLATAKAILAGKQSEAIAASGPAGGGFGPPAIPASVPAGVTVYVRRWPHAGDAATPASPASPKTSFLWEGCTLAYGSIR